MTHPISTARTRAGPDLDALADQITIDVLIEAFAEHGITLRAVRAAWHAVIHSDAIEEEAIAGARTIRDR